jgi:hypothetical protein
MPLHSAERRLTISSYPQAGHCNDLGEYSPVTKQDDYRNNAAETVELASKASTPRDKARLLGMAEKWLDLAERVHRTTRNQIGMLRLEHPLVRSRLRDFKQA